MEQMEESEWGRGGDRRSVGKLKYSGLTHSNNETVEGISTPENVTRVYNFESI